ncbi:DUF2806 domain-containing protein [Mesorhizobium sp. AaZ16]|uniref:DUF2806 domain-containing protein n=1 Tax=Mesorhizobium sp. AaZ16 TaxID=3402289 RepID=UPI00374ECC8E
MKAAAARAAELGIQDVPRMIRGFDNLIGRAFREQVNKDAVAGKTIEDLEAEPSPADSPGPSDDWLNVFEGYAAKATSDGLRDLWARVLAGEIRKPASFSLATLHLISILDGEMAQGIEYILDRALDGSVALIDFPETKQQSLLIGAARSAGVILDSDQNARLERAISAEGIMHYRVGETGIIGVGKPGTRLFFDGIGLTKVGRELWRALQPKGDEQTIESTINLLRSDPGLERITRGRIPKGSGRTILQNPKVVWQRANGATQ